MKLVLGIETSCDDTSVALVGLEGHVVGHRGANQDSAHRPFGGIVPELAGRYHTELLLPMLDELLQSTQKSWEQIDGIAVTCRPGLVGSLLVGVLCAKTLALAKKKPLIGVNHLEGHLVAPFLRDSEYSPPGDFAFPYVALAVSGGHSSLYLVKGFGEYEVLGSTVDDAAGEAFDKFAKLVGLGFPGGAKVDAWAQKGNPKAYEFPLPLKEEGNLQMSFSGLKTAALHLIQKLPQEKIEGLLPDLCASFQEAIVDSLLFKLERAIKKTGVTRFVVTGGVSANTRLRYRSQRLAAERGYGFVVPPFRYCTDNAAMIAYAGLERFLLGQTSGMDLAVSPEIGFEDLACTT